MARWTKQQNKRARLGMKITNVSAFVDVCQGQAQHKDCLQYPYPRYQVHRADKLGTKISYISVSVPVIPTKLACVSR